MRIVFWLVGLFAVAAALALLMGQNSATVTLFWAPYRVDMSFNLVIAAVLLLFLLLLFSAFLWQEYNLKPIFDLDSDIFLQYPEFLWR